MSHVPRLSQALRDLLERQRIAALGTRNPDGSPFVSMVPFALDKEAGTLVIHISGLAPHTGNLLQAPQVSLMVMQSEVPGEPVHALARVTFEGQAQALAPESDDWQRARSAYLARFPEAEPMTQLGDFMFVGIAPSGARQVAGFGAARALDAQALGEVLRDF